MATLSGKITKFTKQRKILTEHLTIEALQEMWEDAIELEKQVNKLNERNSVDEGEKVCDYITIKVPENWNEIMLALQEATIERR